MRTEELMDLVRASHPTPHRLYQKDAPKEAIAAQSKGWVRISYGDDWLLGDFVDISLTDAARPRRGSLVGRLLSLSGLSKVSP